MGTSALFSALNSLPLDEDEDGGDASEDDDYEGYSSEEGLPQTMTTHQKPKRPTGKQSNTRTVIQLMPSETSRLFAEYNPTHVYAARRRHGEHQLGRRSTCSSKLQIPQFPLSCQYRCSKSSVSSSHRNSIPARQLFFSRGGSRPNGYR
jgi:hypothetical protein